VDFKHILITGGAGFVGSTLGVRFRQAFPSLAVTAFDNLLRRGSELNLPRLRAAGVAFVHGDVRCPQDFETLPPFDLLIDCSAEPSVQAGAHGSPLSVLEINLVGTIHCLEAARRHNAAFLFLSTSRVYPISLLNGLDFEERETRFAWKDRQTVPGCSGRGISEGAPLDGARSFYGASKLAGELLLQEYAATCRMPALINRCGVLAGPWQMGKADQGVAALWVARHLFELPLRYIGFGGQGKQVRDILHVEDLFDLVCLQCRNLACWDGRAYVVGGGLDRSISLQELTALCREATGRKIVITPSPETSPLDVRIFVADSASAMKDFGWRPMRDLETVVRDISSWIQAHREMVRTIFAG
jgi:CDP-paratose 2-epimerase